VKIIYCKSYTLSEDQILKVFAGENIFAYVTRIESNLGHPMDGLISDEINKIFKQQQRQDLRNVNIENKASFS
jgi:hypothetical protein